MVRVDKKQAKLEYFLEIFPKINYLSIDWVEMRDYLARKKNMCASVVQACR
jgi:hypothetical protein